MNAELDLKLPEPEISAEEIQRLLRVLSDAGDKPRPAVEGERARPPGWLSAVEIAAGMGDGATDRLVRKIASAARPAVVSYPGSPGYKLWQLCTIEEINHCIEAMESQIRAMVKDVVLYRQAYHKRFRGAPGGDITAGDEVALAPEKLAFRGPFKSAL